MPRDEFLYQVGVMRQHPSKGPCACDPFYNKWCAFHADFDGSNPNSPAYMIGRHSVKCGVCGCNVVVPEGTEPICTASFGRLIVSTDQPPARRVGKDVPR
jgi:hypothetical protein